MLISSALYCAHSKIHAAPNIFYADKTSLEILVNAGRLGLVSASLRLKSENPTTFRLQTDSISALIGTVEGMATYDVDSETLSLPEVVIDGKIAYRDVVFRVADSADQLFVLLSARRNTSSALELISPSCTDDTPYRNTIYCSFNLNGFRREFFVYLPSSLSLIHI